MTARPERPAGARRTLIVTLVVVVGMTVLGAVLYVRSIQRASRGADLFAVVPFDIADTGLVDVRDQLLERIPAALAVYPGLRVVPPDTVRRWLGPRRGLSASRDLGRSVGARFVVFGGLAAASGDSLRVRASVLDVFTGTLGADVIATGTRTGPDSVARMLASAIRAQMTSGR